MMPVPEQTGDTAHRCFAGCRRSRPKHHLMCAQCWRLVPEPLQDAVNAAARKLVRGYPGAQAEWTKAAEAARAAARHSPQWKEVARHG